MRKFISLCSFYISILIVFYLSFTYIYPKIKFIFSKIIFNFSLIFNPYIFLLSLIFANTAFVTPNLKCASQLSKLNI